MVLNSQGDEFVFSFEPDCFEAMANTINEFLEKGETTHDHTKTNGRIKLESIGLWMDKDKRAAIEVELGEPKENDPSLIIHSGKTELYMNLNETQIRAFKETLEKIIEIKKLSKEIEKKQIIDSA